MYCPKRSYYLRNKERIKAKQYLDMITSPKIDCACGCGGKLYSLDKRLRPRKYIHNHHRFGISIAEETKKKIGLANKRVASPEEVLKLRKMAEKRRGVKLSPEHIEKISGENHHGWMGGVPREYPNDFNNTFKTLIHSRDGGRCLLCDNNKKLHVHHIDRNRNNSTPENCMTLCSKCHNRIHSKVVFELTIQLFHRFISNKYGYEYPEMKT